MDFDMPEESPPRRASNLCYQCDERGTTREHYPPKCFFPKKANLQLKTIASCELHNNGKSQDDQYVLAHISMHASRPDNLAQRVFVRSILPQLDQAAFKRTLADGARPVADGVEYPIDITRFNSFFDSLTRAIFVAEYGALLDPKVFRMRHAYLSLRSESLQETMAHQMLRSQRARFFDRYAEKIKRVEADRIDEVIYAHDITAPAGLKASISIGHTFYGSFEVVSLLTNRNVHWNLQDDA